MKSAYLLKVQFFLGLALLMILPWMSSCRKYPDGPTFSLQSREARVVNDWKATSISRNTINETSQFSTFRMKFDDSKNLLWEMQKAGGALETYNATWELFRVDQEIKITMLDPDPVSGDILSYNFDIRKLESSEIWLHFFWEGDEYDVQLGE
ncbi:MAG: hypothetical protein AAFY71_08355 [Bacteroidota bacterium]